MNIIRRLRNLWRLGAYRIEDVIRAEGPNRIFKDFPTMERRMATVIPPAKADPFAPENQDQNDD